MNKAEKIKILEKAISDLSTIRENIMEVREYDIPNHIGFHLAGELPPAKAEERLAKYNAVLDGLEEMYDEILPELIATMKNVKIKTDEEVFRKYANRKN